jgi:hypothetical protein
MLMNFRATSFVTGTLVFSVTLAGVCLAPGCSDETHETGTMVTKPAGAAAAEKKSMEGMKAIMKSVAKKQKR